MNAIKFEVGKLTSSENLSSVIFVFGLRLTMTTLALTVLMLVRWTV
jgi:hypothetical protein